MRRSALLLALSCLLGSTALASPPAGASPYAVGRLGYDSYGPLPAPTDGPWPQDPYRSGPGYRGGYRAGSGHGYAGRFGDPIAAEPVPEAPVPRRQCNVGTVLSGAAIGGGLGAMLANNSRNRRWSLPMGAAMGGILGGVLSGC